MKLVKIVSLFGSFCEARIRSWKDIRNSLSCSGLTHRVSNMSKKCDGSHLSRMDLAEYQTAFLYLSTKNPKLNVVCSGSFEFIGSSRLVGSFLTRPRPIPRGYNSTNGTVACSKITLNFRFFSTGCFALDAFCFFPGVEVDFFGCLAGPCCLVECFGLRTDSFGLGEVASEFLVSGSLISSAEAIISSGKLWPAIL